MWPISSDPPVDLDVLALGIGVDEVGNFLPGTVLQLRRLRTGRWPLLAGGSGDAGGGDGGGDDGGQGGGDGGTITPPGGTPSTAGTAGDEPGDEPPEQWPEEAKAHFRKLRKLQQQAEKDARDARTQLEQRAQAGMSEAERNANRVRELEQQLSERNQRLRDAAMREAFRAAGIAAKAKDPEAVWMLVDKPSIDWGPDGEVLNATQIMGDLRRSYAWAFESRQGQRTAVDAAQGAQQQAATSGADQTRNKQMNEWFRSAAGRGG